MYSKETIEKVVRMARERIHYYMNPNINLKDIKLTISTGNKKIGRVLNVSTMAIITCPNCKECCKWCYELKAYLIYASCLDARARNTALLMRDRKEYFNRIIKRLARRRKGLKAFRWHVGGEIIDTDYFANMVRIAKLFSEWRFWTYTKNYTAVNEWIRANGNDKSAIPGNLSVMFSEWQGMPMNNPYGLPTFSCVMVSQGQAFKKGVWRCPGNCEKCLESGHGCPFGESAQVADH